MKLRIFLVDDNADTLLLLGSLLQDAGHDVRSAGSMHAALRDLAASRCDVLISDVGLPDGSGVELVRTLRAAGELPYAIAVSGYGTAADIAASRDAGFRVHLVKPIDIDDLERLLDAAADDLSTQARADTERIVRP